MASAKGTSNEAREPGATKTPRASNAAAKLQAAQNEKTKAMSRTMSH
jgi:hypothetical protein